MRSSDPRHAGTALSLALAVLACGGSVQPSPPAPPEPAPSRLATPRVPPAALDAPGLARFYAAIDHRLAWARDSGAALEVLGGAAADGLDPAAYRRPRETDPALRDVALTRALLRYARDLSVGRVSPESVDSLWRHANPFDPVEAVVSAHRQGRVRELPAALRPPHQGYAALRRFLAGPDSALVALNLERWRWLPRALGARHVWADVPGGRVVVVEDGVVRLASRAVVGRLDWPTPMLVGAAARLVLSPTWTVPPGIVRAELLPAVRRDSAWLTRHGYDVFAGTRRVLPDTVRWTALPDSVALRLRFVMPPGPANPMGLVKLTFANPFGIALHDTPDRAAFEDTTCALSHGCVRVERMADVVAWLLEPAGWTADSVRAALGAPSARERPLDLTQPIPVYLTYFTAAVDPSGALLRLPDRYGWDPRLRAALARPDRP